MVVLFEMREGRSKGAFIPGPLERYVLWGLLLKDLCIYPGVTTVSSGNLNDSLSFCALGMH